MTDIERIVEAKVILNSVRERITAITYRLSHADEAAKEAVLNGESFQIDGENCDYKKLREELMEAEQAVMQLDPQSLVANSLLSSAITPGDLPGTIQNIRWAWNGYGGCDNFLLCWTYFDSWGVNITFGDGSVFPFAHVFRNGKSPHDCIQQALNELNGGGNAGAAKALAVEWAMASQIHNRPVWEWYRTHPEEVIQAIHIVTGR